MTSRMLSTRRNPRRTGGVVGRGGGAVGSYDSGSGEAIGPAPVAGRWWIDGREIGKERPCRRPGVKSAEVEAAAGRPIPGPAMMDVSGRVSSHETILADPDARRTDHVRNRRI